MSLFVEICKMLAARNCYESGVTVKEISKQAKVSESTIHKWLKTSKTRMRKA